MKALLITLSVLCAVLPIAYIELSPLPTVDEQLASMDWGEDMCNSFVYTPYGTCGIEAMRWVAADLADRHSVAHLEDAAVIFFLAVLAATFIYCLVDTAVDMRAEAKRAAHHATRSRYHHSGYTVDSTCRHVDSAIAVIKH